MLTALTMLHKLTVFSLLLLCACPPSLYSADTALTPQTKDGFGAMLFFTEDLDFPKRFYAGGEITLDATTQVTVGKPFLMIVNFFGPGLSDSHEPQLAMDILISKPDGTEYMKAEGAQVWAGKYPFSASSTQLADAIVKITIEPGDPIGTYKAEVKLKDTIKKVEVDLEKEFTVTK
jgi:hypothetical protein